MRKRQKQKPRRQRRWFTPTELVEMWDRWQRGETTEEIGDMCWTGPAQRFTSNWPCMVVSVRDRGVAPRGL